MACATGVVVMDPFSTSVLVYGGLYLVVAAIVVVGGTSDGGSAANISGI